MSYGYNNRTQMLRIPAPGRIEDRTVDGSCNPYLAATAMLAAGLDGIERGLEAGDPRRVRHVRSENERVLAAVGAFESGDAATLGALFAASHASLRDDYAVSTPKLDALVQAALEAGAFAARMTGGGFGGSVVALAGAGRAAAVLAAAPAGWVVRPVDGAIRRRTGSTRGRA